MGKAYRMNAHQFLKLKAILCRRWTCSRKIIRQHEITLSRTAKRTRYFRSPTTPTRLGYLLKGKHIDNVLINLRTHFFILVQFTIWLREMVIRRGQEA